MLLPIQIEDLNKRIAQIKSIKIEAKNIICFPEINLNETQIEIMATHFFDWNKIEFTEYYYGKLHGEILFPSSLFNTREDAPDFQELIDMAIESLKNPETEVERLKNELETLKKALEMFTSAIENEDIVMYDNLDHDGRSSTPNKIYNEAKTALKTITTKPND